MLSNADRDRANRVMEAELRMRKIEIAKLERAYEQGWRDARAGGGIIRPPASFACPARSGRDRPVEGCPRGPRTTL